MPKEPKANKRQRPSSNPLSNLNLTDFIEPKAKEKSKKKDSLKDLQKEYERILHKEIQRKNKAFRVIFNKYPDLLFIAFCGSRGAAKWKAAKHFKHSFHPLFTGEQADKEMLESHAYRIQEFDKYATTGLIPIPALLNTLDMTLPCSVCGKHRFSYSDYLEDNCYIIEGEGNSNPFTKGYILCPECYKKVNYPCN